MDTLGLVNAADYYDRLMQSASEYAELVESVIVAETWFFREPGSFAGLARIAVGPNCTPTKR